MATTLDAVIEQTESGARIIGEQHDPNAINWRAAQGDLLEMSNVARVEGETLEQYSKRAAISRANLHVAADGEIAMAGVLSTGWHELGITVDKPMTGEEVLTLAKLKGWNIELVPETFEHEGRQVPTGKFSVVRRDIGKSLGQGISDRYQVVSNEAIIEFMDCVIEQGARYETAGALGNGEKVWVLARFPEVHQVAPGDEIETYVMCAFGHNGKQAIRPFATSNRTCCQNTMNQALRMDGSKGCSIAHFGDIKEKVKMAQQAVGLAKKAHAEYAELASELARTELSILPREYFERCLDTSIATTIAGQRVSSRTIADGSAERGISQIEDLEKRQRAEKQYVRHTKKREGLLDDILARHEGERCEGIEAIRGSAWSAFNAFTEHACHSKQYGYQGENDREKAEGRFESLLMGKAQKSSEVALELAVEYASAS